eukprot:GHVU01137707.1.p1 GENE.GHVU01137707.1~~GHVU01137707.1.p1  ORF type:complete len:358 (+),score=66.64 GHVU01137707.1:787-1860(+)
MSSSLYGNGNQHSSLTKPVATRSLSHSFSDYACGAPLSVGAPALGGMTRNVDSVPPAVDESPPFATPEGFEDMVGDLRRTFIGWLKTTESELRIERERLRRLREDFQLEREKQERELATQRQKEFERMQEERRRMDAEAASVGKQMAAEREEARKVIKEDRDKFERERETIRRKLFVERERVHQEFARVHAEKEKILDTNIATETMVDLNVGGVIFETSRLTLVQQAGSYLEAVLSGRHQVNRDKQGRIFIDRDSEVFRSILGFLRDPAMPPIPRDATESDALIRDAEYYGIKFCPFPLVYAVGGHSGVEHLKSVEVLDAKEQRWRTCKQMETGKKRTNYTYLSNYLTIYLTIYLTS